MSDLLTDTYFGTFFFFFALICIYTSSAGVKLTRTSGLHVLNLLAATEVTKADYFISQAQHGKLSAVRACVRACVCVWGGG